MKKLLFILFLIPLVSDSVGVKPPWLHRPVANAGADQTISISTATLSGSAVSTNGASYRWFQVSGPNTAIMSAPTSATNNLSGLVAGVYVFRVQVMDNGGSEGSNKMILTVN